MSFTGKAKYQGVLPAGREDLWDMVKIIAPYEVPLLNFLGDAERTATTGEYEWLEDNPTPDKQGWLRTKCKNLTREFWLPVSVNVAKAEFDKTKEACSSVRMEDLRDYAKQEVVRDMLHTLECMIINGFPGGGDLITKGFRQFLHGRIVGGGYVIKPLDVEIQVAGINEYGAGCVDLIVFHPVHWKRIKEFNDVETNATPCFWETASGNCTVIQSKHVTKDTILLLDSTKISVIPREGGSFHFRHNPKGQEIGNVFAEYTLEFRNPMAHGCIVGLKH